MGPSKEGPFSCPASAARERVWLCLSQFRRRPAGWPRAGSERRRNSNPRKLYPADPGLIKAFDASGHSNVGHALETAVLNELERRGTEVSHVKTGDGLEVDFRVRSNDCWCSTAMRSCAPTRQGSTYCLPTSGSSRHHKTTEPETGRHPWPSPLRAPGEEARMAHGIVRLIIRTNSLAFHLPRRR